MAAGERLSCGSAEIWETSYMKEPVLSDEMLKKIEKLYRDPNYSTRAIAERFGVSPSHISAIMKLRNVTVPGRTRQRVRSVA